MSLANFHVTLDNPSETFYTGQIVSGNLNFVLAREKKVKGVTVQFRGEGYCSWSETSSTHHHHHHHRHHGHHGRSSTRTTTHQNHEVYLDQTLYVVGEPGQELTLNPGNYTYPFRFQLPPALPSSFEGEKGYVRFVVRGTLVRPWRFDHRCKRAFTVISPLDLNLLMTVQQPCHVQSEKVLCCGCCASSPITLLVRMPCQGFVPGQKPKAVVELDNPTDETVDIKCHLMQIVYYTAYSGKRYEIQKIVASERLGNVAKRGSLCRQSDLQIPALPPTTMQFGSCIQISYAFQVMGEMGSGTHGPVIANVPITLGTIPIMALMPMEQGVPIGARPADPVAGPSGMQAPIGFVDPLAEYPQLSPPSYEECVSGKSNIRTEDDKYEQGDMEFAPRYPMYNF